MKEIGHYMWVFSCYANTIRICLYARGVQLNVPSTYRNLDSSAIMLMNLDWNIRMFSMMYCVRRYDMYLRPKLDLRVVIIDRQMSDGSRMVPSILVLPSTIHRLMMAFLGISVSLY